MVIAFIMPFSYTGFTIKKGDGSMEQRKNLGAQVPLSLHNRGTEAREQLGQTTAEYITDLLTEYYEMKENGGNTAMTNGKNRTLAFQIEEALFQRIKAHLERESVRLGRKVTQREFVLDVIIKALNMAEPMDVDESGVGPREAAEPEVGSQEQDAPSQGGEEPCEAKEDLTASQDE